jgi:inorganic pyrophosphatase
VIGAPYTFEHRIFFEKNGVVVSPWHDIPLLASAPTASPQIFNMIVEIPRWSNAKQEISKDLDYNPIKQDIKKGKLRFVRNCFPHHGYPFTYGAIPQVHNAPSLIGFTSGG